MSQKNHFDLFVIGGGSGGLACAKQAAKLGFKVGLADFVKPSPSGTKWGLGGTCVNVGCIPKKLFHFSSIVGELLKDAKFHDWKIPGRPTHSWEAVRQRINDYIISLNRGYKKELQNEQVTYFNKLAKFINATTLELKALDGSKQIVTADHIVIATGGRPTYPEIKGALEHSITSDDIFWLPKSPGKTLVVGASYIALECAGFLHGIGVDVTVMVRSIFLRGFDQEIANKIGAHMSKQGVKFINTAVPVEIRQGKDGKKIVKYKQGEKENQKQRETVFDTVLFAIGRSADTKGLNLNQIGLKTAENGKIICSEDDKTSVKNIYAIGDVVQGRLELTPTAIMAGKLLSQRLFGKGRQMMSYRTVPTTVFTPLEYGCCGYSEQDSIKKYGHDNIVIYASEFKPLEWATNKHKDEDCYLKVICNRADNQKIVGFHYVGPNAGQITQGMALALRKNATKEDLDMCVGIETSISEQLQNLKEANKFLPQESTDQCCSIF